MKTRFYKNLRKHNISVATVNNKEDIQRNINKRILKLQDDLEQLVYTQWNEMLKEAKEDIEEAFKRGFIKEEDRVKMYREFRQNLKDDLETLDKWVAYKSLDNDAKDLSELFLNWNPEEEE